jgi:dihydrodipicolinate synthase/N-acetylneuraminate lyase
MKPNDVELRNYYNSVLGRAHHPVALAINRDHPPSVAIIAELIQRYPQIECVFLPNSPDSYFVSLRQLVSRNVTYFAQITGSLNLLELGASGLFATEANVMPKTYRRYVDLVEQGNYVEAGRVYADIKRLLNYMEPWGHTNARWIKMFMHVMKIPGGAGGLRDPYALPPAEELSRFTKGLLSLGIAEVDEQAREAGVHITA